MFEGHVHKVLGVVEELGILDRLQNRSVTVDLTEKRNNIIQHDLEKVTKGKKKEKDEEGELKYFGSNVPSFPRNLLFHQPSYSKMFSWY